jgi:hypothetical protein
VVSELHHLYGGEAWPWKSPQAQQAASKQPDWWSVVESTFGPMQSPNGYHLQQQQAKEQA